MNSLSSEGITEQIWDNFVEQYGDHAIPVSSQYDADKIKSSKIKPIIVSQSRMSILKSSTCYGSIYHTSCEEQPSIKNMLSEWFNKINHSYLTFDEEDEFNKILNKISDEYTGI